MEYRIMEKYKTNKSNYIKLQYSGGIQPNLKWFNNRCFGDVVLQILYSAIDIREYILYDVVSDDLTTDKNVIKIRENWATNQNLIKIREDLRIMNKNARIVEREKSKNIALQIDNNFENCEAMWKVIGDNIETGTHQSANLLLEKILSYIDANKKLYAIHNIIYKDDNDMINIIPDKTNVYVNNVSENTNYYIAGVPDVTATYLFLCGSYGNGRRAYMNPPSEYILIKNNENNKYVHYRLVSFFVNLLDHYVFYAKKGEKYMKYDDKQNFIEQIEELSRMRATEMTVCYKKID